MTLVGSVGSLERSVGEVIDTDEDGTLLGAKEHRPDASRHL